VVLDGPEVREARNRKKLGARVQNHEAVGWDRMTVPMPNGCVFPWHGFNDTGVPADARSVLRHWSDAEDTEDAHIDSKIMHCAAQASGLAQPGAPAQAVFSGITLHVRSLDEVVRVGAVECYCPHGLDEA
jgi:hypothetical protein